METGSYLCIIGKERAQGARAKFRRYLHGAGWQEAGNAWAWGRIPCNRIAAQMVARHAADIGIACSLVPVSDEAYRGILHA